MIRFSVEAFVTFIKQHTVHEGVVANYNLIESAKC